MQKWAYEQLQILNVANLDPLSRFVTASSFSHFGIDPTSIASILVVFNKNQVFLTFEQLASLADIMDISIFKSGHIDNHAETYHNITELEGRALIRPLINGDFIRLELIDNVPKNNNSIIDCLHRTLIKRGKNPVWTIEKSVAQSFFGRMDILTVSVLSGNH